MVSSAEQSKTSVRNTDKVEN